MPAEYTRSILIKHAVSQSQGRFTIVMTEAKLIQRAYIFVARMRNAQIDVGEDIHCFHNNIITGYKPGGNGGKGPKGMNTVDKHNIIHGATQLSLCGQNV